MTTSSRVPYSYLFVPGDREDRFEKACASAADAVIIDLEDAVAPHSKAIAREKVERWLNDGGKAYVRINGADTQWFAEDLRLLNASGLEGIMLPKSEAPEPIEKLASAMKDDIPLVLLIETAQGLLRAPELARLRGVSRLAFGSVDFQLDCGIPDDDMGLAYARAQLVLASAAARVAPPVDGVTTEMDDLDVLRRETERARRLGFGGKLCIHPRQLDVVNEGFAASPEDVAQAREILEVVAASGNLGAARHRGKLIDRPIFEWAKRIMARHEP